MQTLTLSWAGVSPTKVTLLLLAVTVSNLVTIVFHSHFPTTQISGSRRPPFTFCIRLNHVPNFSLSFRQFSFRFALSNPRLSYISDTDQVQDLLDMTEASESQLTAS